MVVDVVLDSVVVSCTLPNDSPKMNSKDALEASLICYYFFKLGKYCFSKGEEVLYVLLGI